MLLLSQGAGVRGTTTGQNPGAESVPWRWQSPPEQAQGFPLLHGYPLNSLATLLHNSRGSQHSTPLLPPLPLGRQPAAASSHAPDRDFSQSGMQATDITQQQQIARPNASRGQLPAARPPLASQSASRGSSGAARRESSNSAASPELSPNVPWTAPLPLSTPGSWPDHPAPSRPAWGWQPSGVPTVHPRESNASPERDARDGQTSGRLQQRDDLVDALDGRWMGFASAIPVSALPREGSVRQARAAGAESSGQQHAGVAELCCAS